MPILPPAPKLAPASIGIPNPITSIPTLDSSAPVIPQITTQNENTMTNLPMNTETAANALRDRALVNALRAIPAYL